VLLQSQGFQAVRWISAHEALEIEPEINEGLSGAFYDPDGHHIHPERFTRALAQAAAQRGVKFELGVEATGIERSGRLATGIQTTRGLVSAGHVVLASGSWSAFEDAWIEFPLPVSPARGQILTVAALPAPIRHVLNGTGIYLVPR